MKRRFRNSCHWATIDLIYARTSKGGVLRKRSLRYAKKQIGRAARRHDKAIIAEQLEAM